MRPPCVQISLRALIFVVAVLAVNLGVLRFAYATVSKNHGGFPLAMNFDSYGFAFGFVPLVNFALVAALRLAWRSIHAGRARSPQSRPAAFTFLTLHFAALAGILIWLLPEVIARLCAVCGIRSGANSAKLAGSLRVVR